MRLSWYIACVALGWNLPVGVCREHDIGLQKRQDTASTAFPSLTTDIPSTVTDVATSNSDTSTLITTTLGQAATSSDTALSSSAYYNSTISILISTTKRPSSASSPVATPTATSAVNGTAGASRQEPDELPIKPKITPAFGMAGVFLIVLGAAYATIGVKSRGLQIFLSCGFLASIATTALVDYVMNTPVTNAVQGGFFVAIFMTGAIFGGGCLVFKEFTEGFACLLGGFCFSMWLLTLRPGGIITNSAGKGVFIAVFCVTIWALSWTHYTRTYGIIGSTAFSGATAFTLGIDCFTRAGLKEFWFYIWNLNDDLFPLNTDTFPITRGVKVEIALIVIGTIIGVLSQLKLWKMIRSEEREKEVSEEENFRQRVAVEAALGRHLQRQNDQEKTPWERQHGSRLSSQRNTVLWQTAHPEKQYSSVSVAQINPSKQSASAESLELNAFGPRRTESAYGSRIRQSTMTVDAIEEVDEDAMARKERQKALQALERSKTPLGLVVERTASDESVPTKSSTGVSKQARLSQADMDDHMTPARDPINMKRRSQQSLSRRSKHLSANYNDNSASQEHLLDVDRPHSRASSVAATMDLDNEDFDLDDIEVELEREVQQPPEIVISAAENGEPARKPTAMALEKDASSHKSAQPSTAIDNLEQLPLLVEPVQTEDSAANVLESHTTTAIGDSRMETGEASKPQSHASEVTDSSADTLTKTALATVPSQLSTVVLSYRTNEWAKHITAAEEPVYDEPDTIGGIDDELPTQLAVVTRGVEANDRATEPVAKIEPAAPLPATVQAGGAGVGIATKPPAAARSYSDQERRRSETRPLPSRSASSQSARHSSSRGARTSHNPTLQSSLVSTPIDEDAPTEFTSLHKTTRRVSAPQNLPSRSNTRPQTSLGSSSYYNRTSDVTHIARPQTQQSLRPGLSTGTRMESYNSHLPAPKGQTTDAQKRETLLADWRLSHQHRANSTGIMGATGELGRAQLKAQKDNQRAMDEYQRSTQQQKQLAMDQMMRRPDMQDLHRVAMQKMQANANKKLRSASD